MKLFVRHRRGFTLLEIFVVLGIIAMFLALLVPFFMRMREGGRSQACVANMQAIGKAMRAYAAEHQDQLPGPASGGLSSDQYPQDSAGNPIRDNQLLKYLSTYLNTPAGGASAGGTARNTFTFPSWQSAEHTTDAPVFILNNEPVTPPGQPAWGAKDKAPLKFADLKVWTHKLNDKEKEEPVELARRWALTEADQEIAKLVQIKEPWVSMTPPKAVHVSHRNALYFDMHVEPLVLTKASSDATIEQN
jgi:prepilin-type N-terminal cleavage/methylation domain-containing protein